MSRRGLVIDHFVQVFDATRRDLLHRFDHTRGYAYGETLCGLSSRLMWLKRTETQGVDLPACPECELRWEPPSNSIACIDCQAVGIDPPGGGLPPGWGMSMRNLGAGLEGCYVCPDHLDPEPGDAPGCYRETFPRQVVNHRPALGRSLAVLDCGHDIDQEDVDPLPRIGATFSCPDCEAICFPPRPGR